MLYFSIHATVCNDYCLLGHRFLKKKAHLLGVRAFLPGRQSRMESGDQYKNPKGTEGWYGLKPTKAKQVDVFSARNPLVLQA